MTGRGLKRTSKGYDSLKTKAQRIADAMTRVDETGADLLAAAERWTLTNRSIWDIRNDRVTLYREARRYANALRRLWSL